MKKITLKKLELHRETLVPLQAAELDDVNGGTLSAVVRSVVQATKNLCPTLVTTVASTPLITCKGAQ
ncbi:MAG: hypothetical protein H0V17_36275 [Deltaproteobacteria bacterium]|nr:hypothetical protein [Deltaproteobacteria bacterium]